ncbi:MAG: hypothetical protein KF693_05180 [Nitrospira sp.]|nr:hypothetical protein [Nitrospira sp.]
MAFCANQLTTLDAEVALVIAIFECVREAIPTIRPSLSDRPNRSDDFSGNIGVAVCFWFKTAVALIDSGRGRTFDFG